MAPNGKHKSQQDRNTSEKSVMSSGKSMSSSSKGSQNGSHSPLYLKNKQKNTNPSGNSTEIPIKSTSKRVPEEEWWFISQERNTKNPVPYWN